MRRVIYKYEITELGKVHSISMPYSHEIENFASIRHVGVDGKGSICVWAEVDADAEVRERNFFMVGTGYEIPESVREDATQFTYVGSVEIEAQGIPVMWMIFHVYDLGCGYKEI